jgi:hypothetical protein
LEKRKYERKKVAGKVNGKMILIDHINLIDLSLNGVRFQCGKRVGMNGIHRIKIEKGGISLSIKGQVVRSTLSIKKRGSECLPVYEIAMTFRNLSQETKKSLEEFISQIGNG